MLNKPAAGTQSERAAAGASRTSGPATQVVGGVVGWFLGSGNYLGVLMGLVIGAALGITLLGSHGEERKRVIALFIVVFFVIFFFCMLLLRRQ